MHETQTQGLRSAGPRGDRKDGPPGDAVASRDCVPRELLSGDPCRARMLDLPFPSGRSPSSSDAQRRAVYARPAGAT
jgi:hypothetical protein